MLTECELGQLTRRSAMGAHGSKERLYRTGSEKFPEKYQDKFQSKIQLSGDKKYKAAVNRERFGSFGVRGMSCLHRSRTDLRVWNIMCMYCGLSVYVCKSAENAVFMESSNADGC